MIGCSVFVSVILLFFGVLFLLENLDVADNLVGKYWPVILIVLGLMSLFNMVRFRFRVNQFRNRFRERWPPDIDG